MPKIIKKHGKTALIFALILVLIGYYYLIPTIQAANITSRKMVVSDSRPTPQAGVTYTFTGTHSVTPVACLRIQYCTTATGTCTKPTSMVTTTATKGTFTGWTTVAWTIDATTDGETKYTHATTEAGGAGYVIQTSTITNPVAGVYFARVTTYTNANCTDGSTDTGTVAYSITGGVAITATVAETLTFTISDSAIGFGELGTGAIFYATDDEAGSTTEPVNDLPVKLALSTNGVGGATITIQDTGDDIGYSGLYKSAAPTATILATGPSTVAAGVESYAPYGKNASSSLAIAAGFQTGGATAVSRTAQTFVTAAAALSTNNTVDLVAKAGITATTPSGSYADTLILIATPTF